MKLKKLINESEQRYCSIYKAKNKKWYLELANREYGTRRDATTYGPFDTQEDADNELRNHSNPGGLDIDTSGKAPVPKKSPNGRPIVTPRARGRYDW